MSVTTWADLTREPIRMAVDTEYGPVDNTLTVQFAARVGSTVFVQVYHSADIPPPQRRWFGREFAATFAKWTDRVIIRRAKPLVCDLSPTRVVADVLGLPAAEHLSRAEGLAQAAPKEEHDAKRDRTGDSREALVRSIELRLIGHFLRSDFLRAFGSGFWKGLLLPDAQGLRVALREHKVIGLAGSGQEQFRPVVVGHVRDRAGLIAVTMSTGDTNLAFGSARLDDLAKAFLGVGKLKGISAADLPAMKGVFQRRPKEAYRYAVTDVILTLLLSERMDELHRTICCGLGFTAENMPRCHSTPGMRLTSILLGDVARQVSGSTALGVCKGGKPTGQVSSQKLKDLFAAGSAGELGRPGASRYGPQTGHIHGGLLINRSPTKLFHHAPGQFGDVDFGSCYPTILQAMNIYIGRPLVVEPGTKRVTLKEAVAGLEMNAAGWDAWFIKVTGAITAAPNVLIPSTNDAITHRNYKRRAARQRASERHFQQLRDTAERPAKVDSFTALYTDEVSAGIVVWGTWKMIQALPRVLREQYEQLRVETIVFYPSEFVADDGPSFDKLTKKLATGDELDWTQTLNLPGRTLVTREDLDEKYATLKYPIGELADNLMELRRTARRRDGKGSEMDRALKLLGNTVFGALSSPYLPTQNIVAAQVITGTARALAFGMAMSLNSLNLITDGGLYRRDQIPACDLATCIRRHPDYAIRRPEAGLSFLNPDTVPKSDREFSAWYVKHVMRFLGVGGKDYEFLFGMHRMVHKELPGTNSTTFDALCLDGASNYAKLVRGYWDDDWEVIEFKARSFREDAKRQIQEWLVKVCETDRYDGPLDPVDTVSLLTLQEAAAACRKALRARAGTNGAQVVLPVGMARQRIQTYKLLKPSQFTYRSERQKRGLGKEWTKLVEGTCCGPEILATRKTFRGSVVKVAEALYAVIRSKAVRLNGLNIARLLRKTDSPGPVYGRRVAKRRTQLARHFFNSLIVHATLGPGITGLAVTSEEVERLAIQ